jgi:DNA-binding MarR family transcriptional regulator
MGAIASTQQHDLVQWAADLIRLEIVVWERIDRRLRARHQLPLALFEALYFLSRAPDGPAMRVGDLARVIRITVGGTSKLVDRAEAAGLLTRAPDPGDRRAARLALTPPGKRKLRAATTTYHHELAALLDASLSRHEQHQMHAYVRRLLAAADGP